MNLNSIVTPSLLRRKSFDSINRFKENKRCFIEGHRGCRTQPENTLRSIRIAIEKGCDSVEFDVWITKDLIPVVIHGEDDGSIHKSTNGSGIVNDLEYLYLSRLDAGEGEKVPSLEEVIELCKDKVFLNIELKDPQIEKTMNAVLSIIDRFRIRHQIAISSFKHEYFNELKRLNVTDIEFGFLHNSKCKEDLTYDLTRALTTCNFNAKFVTKEIVETAHKYNVAILVWFSTEKNEENEQEYSRILSYGVDIICVNYIDLAVKTRENFL